MFRFENLEIWHLSLDYCDSIYQTTKSFPSDEMYGLSSQLKRAVVSISANIAEGSGCESRMDFRRFLGFAIRSNVEVVSELFVAKQRNFISEADFNLLYSKGELLIKKIKAFKNSL